MEKDGYSLMGYSSSIGYISLGQITPYHLMWWLKLDKTYPCKEYPELCKIWSLVQDEENYHYNTLIWTNAFLETFQAYTADHILKTSNECEKVIKKYEPIVEGSFFAFLMIRTAFSTYISISQKRILYEEFSNRYPEISKELLHLTDELYVKLPFWKILLFFVLDSMKIASDGELSHYGTEGNEIWRKAEILTNLAKLILSTPDPKKALHLLSKIHIHQYKNVADLTSKISAYLNENLGCFPPDYHEIIRDCYIHTCTALLLNDLDLLRKTFLAFAGHLFGFSAMVTIEPHFLKLTPNFGTVVPNNKLTIYSTPSTPLLSRSSEDCFFFDIFKGFKKLKINSAEKKKLFHPIAHTLYTTLSEIEEVLVTNKQLKCERCQKAIDEIHKNKYIQPFLKNMAIKNHFAIKMGAILKNESYEDWLIKDAFERADQSFDSIGKELKLNLSKL